MTKKIENIYLLDTNILSMLYRAKNGDPDPKSKAVLARATEQGDSGNLAICSVSIGEIEYGLNIASKPNQAVHDDLRDYLDSFSQIFVIDKHVAAGCYAELRAALFKKYAPRKDRDRIAAKWPEDLMDETKSKYLGIQENDLWLAAVAMTNGLTLVSNDDMQRIFEVAGDQLMVENWAA